MFNQEIPTDQEVQIPTNILVSLTEAGFTEAALQALSIYNSEKYTKFIENPSIPIELIFNGFTYENLLEMTLEQIDFFIDSTRTRTENLLDETTNSLIDCGFTTSELITASLPKLENFYRNFPFSQIKIPHFKEFKKLITDKKAINILINLEKQELKCLTENINKTPITEIESLLKAGIQPTQLIYNLAGIGNLLQEAVIVSLVDVVDVVDAREVDVLPIAPIVEAPFVDVLPIAPIVEAPEVAPIVDVLPIAPIVEAEEKKNNSELNNTYANVQLKPVVKIVALTKEAKINNLKSFNLDLLGIADDKMNILLQNYDTIIYLLENGCALIQITELSVMKFSQLMRDTKAQEKFIIKCNEENAIVNNNENIETSILEYQENQEYPENVIIGNSANLDPSA